MPIDVMTRTMPFQIPTFPFQPAPDAPRLRSHTRILMVRRSAVNHAAAHPRACGGSYSPPWVPPILNGLSPRVRGNSHRTPEHHSVKRSIPAIAG